MLMVMFWMMLMVMFLMMLMVMVMVLLLPAVMVQASSENASGKTYTLSTLPLSIALPASILSFLFGS